MKHKTGIQWTWVPGRIGATWNPIVGCSPASGSEKGGCLNCYARVLHDQRHKAKRAGKNVKGAQYDEPFAKVRLMEHKLDEPLHWRKPHAIFVGSMTDLFHPDVPDDYLDRVFVTMALSPQHVFMLLTKRPERMREYVGMEFRALAMFTASRGALAHVNHGWPLPNVWLGTSVEDQGAVNRISQLLDTPAAVRFISYEPALGPLAIGPASGYSWSHPDYLTHVEPPNPSAGPAIDWIIVGGESGKGARPFNLAWARSTVEQGRAAGVKVFVKQLGKRPFDVNTCRACHGLPHTNPNERAGWGCGRVGCAVDRLRLRHQHGSDPAEWPEDLRVREFPVVQR